MQHKCYAVVILLFATTAFAEILFTFPPPLAGAYPFYVHRYSGTPTDPNLPPNVPLTGKMATVLNNDSYGEIVLTTYDRLFTKQLTSILFAKLPKAIVVIPPFPDFPGFEQYTHDDYFEQPKLWNIPIGSIHFQTGMKAWAILADNMTADVTLVFRKCCPVITDWGSDLILTSEPNPWQTFADNPSWILIGPVLISGMVLFAFGLSIARLHQFVRAEGFKVTVAQVTLIIQIIINPLIAWWWLVDPAKTRMVIPNQVDNVVEAGTQTAAVTVCIYLGIFFWQELLSKTAIRVAVFVNKLKVPMILVVVAVLMLEYASSVVFTVASLDPSQITQTFTKVRYGIDMALVGITFIYYTIVSIQVMVYIRKMKSGTKDVKKATIRFAIVGFAQLLRVLSDIFPLDGMYLEKTGMLLVLDPVVFRLGHHWLRYLSIAITNLALVSGFRVPQRRGAGLTTGTTRTGLSSSA